MLAIIFSFPLRIGSTGFWTCDQYLDYRDHTGFCDCYGTEPEPFNFSISLTDTKYLSNFTYCAKWKPSGRYNQKSEQYDKRMKDIQNQIGSGARTLHLSVVYEALGGKCCPFTSEVIFINCLWR